MKTKLYLGLALRGAISTFVFQDDAIPILGAVVGIFAGLVGGVHLDKPRQS